MGDRVRAIVDLPDVAEGTEGKVILANGFNWQRHRALFSNGTELPDLDQRTIEPIGRAAKRLAKAAAKAEPGRRTCLMPVLRSQVHQTVHLAAENVRSTSLTRSGE